MEFGGRFMTPRANSDMLPLAERLMEPADLAAYLRVPVSWVREHSSGRRGPQLPCFKVGKYLPYPLPERRARPLAGVARRREERGVRNSERNKWNQSD